MLDADAGGVAGTRFSASSARPLNALPQSGHVCAVGATSYEQWGHPSVIDPSISGHQDTHSIQCCQQYERPACALPEHRVPFFVVAWHRHATDVGRVGAVLQGVAAVGVAAVPSDAGRGALRFCAAGQRYSGRTSLSAGVFRV